MLHPNKTYVGCKHGYLSGTTGVGICLNIGGRNLFFQWTMQSRGILAIGFLAGGAGDTSWNHEDICFRWISTDLEGKLLYGSLNSEMNPHGEKPSDTNGKSFRGRRHVISGTSADGYSSPWHIHVRNKSAGRY